jgi:hypothetical protein
MRLKVKLLPGWKQHDNPDGPATYYRSSSHSPGALQISWLEYKGGKLPNPSIDDVKRSAREFGENHKFGKLIDSTGGTCDFGSLGSAVFSSAEHPRIQNWFLSNGKDFIMVTHICTVEADAIEVQEAQAIVRMLTLGKSARWKFWQRT